MKIKALFALVAMATIISFSCNWFRSKTDVHNPLIGQWRLDSVNVVKDDSIARFLFAAAVNDPAGVTVSFTNDSVFTTSKNGVEAVVYSFDRKTNQMNIEDSANQRFVYKKVNDSLVTLNSTSDSTVLFLVKK